VVLDPQIKNRYAINAENIRKEAWAWFEAILGIVPGMTGDIFRSLAYGILAPNFRGKRARIGRFTHIWFPWHLRIGQRCFIGRNAYINCISDGHLVIGQRVMIAPYVMIITTAHEAESSEIPMQLQGLSSERVVIENDVWIGGKSVILPGVRIGQGSIVSAASVVTKNVPPLAIVAGNPARVIRSRG
jgi:acetyltransferase-like isoleucine patch superfamily enzyme